MNSQKYTYRYNWIFIAVILWEIIFWGIYVFAVGSIGNSGKSTDAMMYKFPAAFNLTFLIAVIIGIYLFNIWRYNKATSKSNSRVLQSLLRPVSTMSSFLKYFFFRNAFVFLIIALAQPIYGKKKVSGTSESLELVVALDISNSMNTKDISKEASRLDISKRALIQLINNLHGEKIGIALFANNAFVQLPLTRDYAAAKLFIQDIESAMITSQGTNISEALEVSVDMFSKEKTTKGIILVTDGENHEVSPDEILKKIKTEKVQLSVLGIGTKKGGLIPKNPHRPELGYKTNAVGKTIVSKMNPKFIQSIATKGGGHANISSNEFPNLSGLLTQINRMKRTKIDNLEFDIKEERYQIPLLISIFFWLAYVLWSKQYVGVLDRIVRR
ncbi:MAG: VWA domain-containing protein [Fluviicola sp.]|nr:VWA domain-containing protein [Fluviicola sp.]